MKFGYASRHLVLFFVRFLVLILFFCLGIMSDQVALETEARISPLINEKRRLFNDLLTAKGTLL